MNINRCMAIGMIVLSMLSMSTLVWAETLTITAEGEYVVGGGESMDIGEDKAQQKAEKNAAEEAGVFVKSYTKVRNLALEEDIIEVVAKHAMKVTVLERKKIALENLSGIRCLVKIKAVMSTQEVEANLKKAREDRGVIDSYNRLKADYDRQAGEMELLKKRLAVASGDEKKQVLAKISDEEKRFKANLWLEKATDLRYLNTEMGLKAYDKALELNPRLVEAYIGKGKLVANTSVGDCAALLSNGPVTCTKLLESQNNALSYLNKAIALDKGYVEAYVVRADVYNNIRNELFRVAYSRNESVEVQNEINNKYAEQILESLTNAISLKPDNPEYYSERSHYYRVLRYDYDNASSDMSRAIVLCRDTDCSMLAHYYEKRAEIYLESGKSELWEKDMAEATKIRAAGNEKYKERSVKDELIMQALLKSEFAKLRQDLYPGSIMDMDEKTAEQTLIALDLKISRKKGTVEDYILRADLGRIQENKHRDYTEAIRLLKTGKPEGVNALLLTRIHLYKAMAYDKQYDQGLKELKNAQHLLEQYLARALNIIKAEDYIAITTASDEGGVNKLMKMTRREAEAFTWIDFANKIINSRAAIYEELGLPVKAKNEYKYLCENLKDNHACKNMDRLK